MVFADVYNPLTMQAQEKSLTKFLSENRGKIDTAKAFEMRYVRGLKIEEIAKYFGCSSSAVTQKLGRFKGILCEKDEIDTYEEKKSQLLSSVELKLLMKLACPGAIKKATLNNAAYAFTQIHTANRLTKGQSTENVNNLQLTMTLDQLDSRERELRKKLLDIQAVVPQDSQEQQTTTNSTNNQ